MNNIVDNEVDAPLLNMSNALSVGALSDMHHQRTAYDLQGIQKWFRFLILLYIPICLGILIMSCEWANITGQIDNYNDISSQWQSCLTAADYSYIPLSDTFEKIQYQISQSSTYMKACISQQTTTDIYCQDANSQRCVYDINSNCFSKTQGTIPSVSDIQLPNGHYLNGFSYLGIQTIIFSAISLASVYRALKHPSWLISTIAMSFWFVVAILTYYTVNPILPTPSQINSTLLTYIYYSRDYSKYKNLNDGDNKCSFAFQLVWIYQSLLLAVVLIVLIGGIMAIYAEKVRYKNPHKKRYKHLKNTELPVFLTAFAAISYLLFITAKIMSMVTEINGIEDFDATAAAQSGIKGFSYTTLWFPFLQSSTDVTTIVGVSGMLSILRGCTVQSLSAFRIACVAGIIYTLSIYPGLVGAYQFYYYNHFNDYNRCKEYFQSGSTSVFGYPDDNDAETYCTAYRLSVLSITMMSFFMHLISLACGYTVYSNQQDGKESIVHDVYDFDQISIIRNSIDQGPGHNNYIGNSKKSDPGFSPVKPESYVKNPLKS